MCPPWKRTVAKDKEFLFFYRLFLLQAFDSLRKQGFAEVVHARAAAINALADPAK